MRRRQVSGAAAALCLLGACATARDDAFEHLNAIRAEYGQPLLTRAQFEEQQRLSRERERHYELQRLRGAGFASADALAKSGRMLVRATFSEPRLSTRMPGVTVELTDSGARVALTSDGRAKVGPALISNSVWEELRVLEPPAFAPDPPAKAAKWRRGDPLPEPPPVCHAWGVTIERIAPRSASKVDAHGCNPGATTAARLAYATKLAEVALTSFPAFASGATNADPLYGLAECFGTFDPATTSNP